jgi:hypothetical protein
MEAHVEGRRRTVARLAADTWPPQRHCDRPGHHGQLAAIIKASAMWSAQLLVTLPLRKPWTEAWWKWTQLPLTALLMHRTPRISAKRCLPLPCPCWLQHPLL